MSEDSEKVASDAIMAMAEEINAKDAEIKRLRKHIKIISGAEGTCYAALWNETERREDAEKEIERLRRNEQVWTSQFLDQERESTRLRNLLAEVIRAQWPPPQEWYERARREIGGD